MELLQNTRNSLCDNKEKSIYYVHRGADKSFAFPICSTTKGFFLGWVKEVRTTKS
jgi:hypothetical protein